MIEIYTDGACSGNPGPGGWGAVILEDGKRNEISGGERATTNNRMEMMAVIKGLESIAGGSTVTVTTDSNYVKNGITQWIFNWIKNNWMTAAKKPVKNQDLWKQLWTLSQNHKVEWKWVKGHSGHPENERCDQLATGEVSNYR